jgi:hypothetical protein
MNQVKLLKAGDAWNVVTKGYLSSSTDLDLAVRKALELAETHGADVELGDGVPRDALMRGRERRQRDLAAAS